MAEASVESRERYAKLVASLLPAGGPTFEPVAEDDGAVQVERGLVLPMALAGAEPERMAAAMGRLLRPGFERARVVDAAGHMRPAYPGLLVYARRRALDVVGRDLPWQESHAGCSALSGWCKRLHESVQRTRATSTSSSPPTSERVAAVVDGSWATLALRACGDADDRPWAFAGVLAAQLSSGAFFRTHASVNPEPYWYHELVLLHAVAAHAALTGDAVAMAAAARNAEYHLNETQPDHATNEPWGLLAFILNPNTHTLADQLLHNVRVIHPHGAQGVTAILLADVLDCLRELARRPG